MIDIYSIKIDEEYLCIKDNKILGEFLKKNDLIKIDYYDPWYHNDGIRFIINNDEICFYEKGISIKKFKQCFLSRSEYRELRINKLLKND